MIVQDIITRVRRTFGDEAAVQIQDADIIRWTNDAQVEIVKHNDAALQKTGFVDLVSGQSVYAMPADLMILRSLRYKFSDMLSFNNLIYKNMQEFDDSIDGWDGSAYTSGNPVFFTMYEGNATLFPTPNQSLVAGLKVLYNQTPATVSLVGDSLSLPLIYHNTVVKYCLWQASLLDDDKDPAVLYRNDFMDDMTGLDQNEVQEPVAFYQTITTLSYDQ
jgi:hypothetical protein